MYVSARLGIHSESCKGQGTVRPLTCITRHNTFSFNWRKSERAPLSVAARQTVCLHVCTVRCWEAWGPNLWGPPCAVTTTCIFVTLKCMHAKFKTRIMNSHNKDGDHSLTCLFNIYSDRGYHTTLQWVRVISSAW